MTLGACRFLALAFVSCDFGHVRACKQSAMATPLEGEEGKAAASPDMKKAVCQGQQHDKIVCLQNVTLSGCKNIVLLPGSSADGSMNVQMQDAFGDLAANETGTGEIAGAKALPLPPRKRPRDFHIEAPMTVTYHGGLPGRSPDQAEDVSQQTRCLTALCLSFHFEWLHRGLAPDDLS